MQTDYTEEELNLVDHEARLAEAKSIATNAAMADHIGYNPDMQVFKVRSKSEPRIQAMEERPDLFEHLDTKTNRVEVQTGIDENDRPLYGEEFQTIVFYRVRIHEYTPQDVVERAKRGEKGGRAGQPGTVACDPESNPNIRSPDDMG